MVGVGSTVRPPVAEGYQEWQRLLPHQKAVSPRPRRWDETGLRLSVEGFLSSAILVYAGAKLGAEDGGEGCFSLLQPPGGATTAALPRRGLLPIGRTERAAVRRRRRRAGNLFPAALAAGSWRRRGDG